jgi:hypothetical protein
LPSIALPRTSKTRPRVTSPTGTLIGPPVSWTAVPRGEAVGRRHRDRADPVVAEVLLDLADQRQIAFALDLDRVVDRGKPAGRELDVDDRSGDLDHLAGGGGGGGGRHGVRCLLLRRAR